MTHDDKAREREQFEEWATPRCLRFATRPDGEYASVTTQEAWEAWQASAALSPASTGQDSEHAVIVDRRDLFDYLRAAWREGQQHGPSCEAESWQMATDHAEMRIMEWKTLRAAPAQQVEAEKPNKGGANG